MIAGFIIFSLPIIIVGLFITIFIVQHLRKPKRNKKYSIADALLWFFLMMCPMVNIFVSLFVLRYAYDLIDWGWFTKKRI